VGLYTSLFIQEEHVESCFMQTNFINKEDISVVESDNCVTLCVLLKRWREATYLGL